MDNLLKIKKENFEKRAEELNSFNAVKSAARFFIYLFNTRNLSKDLVVHVNSLAEDASFVLGQEIKEYDLMFIIETLVEIRPEHISEITASKDGHIVVLAKGKFISPNEVDLLMEEIKALHPDSGINEYIEEKFDELTKDL